MHNKKAESLLNNLNVLATRIVEGDWLLRPLHNPFFGETFHVLFTHETSPSGESLCPIAILLDRNALLLLLTRLDMDDDFRNLCSWTKKDLPIHPFLSKVDSLTCSPSSGTAPSAPSTSTPETPESPPSTSAPPSPPRREDPSSSASE